MAVNRANAEYDLMNQSITMPATVVHYEPRSDFINLTKLIRLMLTKEKEERKEEESQRESTFGSWIWETLMNLGEMIWVTEDCRTNIKGTNGNTNIKIIEGKYIMGYQVKTNKIERTMEDIIKELTNEEWEWLDMDPEVNPYKFPRPQEWDSPKDLRPEWTIEGTQDQAKEVDTQITSVCRLNIPKTVMIMAMVMRRGNQES